MTTNPDADNDDAPDPQEEEWDAHSAFDAMDTAPDVTGADGEPWEDLPDH
jgi:hypothetical protein